MYVFIVLFQGAYCRVLDEMRLLKYFCEFP